MKLDLNTYEYYRDLATFCYMTNHFVREFDRVMDKWLK